MVHCRRMEPLVGLALRSLIGATISTASGVIATGIPVSGKCSPSLISVFGRDFSAIANANDPALAAWRRLPHAALPLPVA
jgi:hypothetical protein